MGVCATVHPPQTDSGVVNLAAASIVASVGGEQKGWHRYTAVGGIVESWVGIVQRTHIQCVIAVVGATCGGSGRVPFGVSGVVETLQVKQIVDCRSVNIVPILVLDAEVVSSDQADVVAAGRVGHSVAVGQNLATCGQPIRVVHRPAIHLVLEDHMKDLLELPPAVALLGLALHVSTVVVHGGNLLGLSLADFEKGVLGIGRIATAKLRQEFRAEQRR